LLFSLVSRKIQIKLHMACICRHLGRGAVCIVRLDFGHTAAEFRAVWFDLSGIARAALPFFGYALTAGHSKAYSYQRSP